MEPIYFKEWDSPKSLRLTDQEYRVLAAHSDIFKVQPRGKNSYRVAPRGGYVGACIISAERQVVIQPKVKMQSFFDLLWLGHRMHGLPELTTDAQFGSGKASDWFAFLILSEIEALLRRQLSSDYVEVKEALFYLRGRIDFSRPFFSDARANCVFNDYRIDTPVNRILKASLQYLADGIFDKQIRNRANALLPDLAYVSSEIPRPDEISALRLGPAYNPYRGLLDLCQLLFSGTGLEYSSGATPAQGLFVSMHRVFERAIYAALFDVLGGSFVRYQPQLNDFIQHIEGNPTKRVSMTPDFVTTKRPTAIISRDPSAAVYVIDAKYRPPLERGARNSSIFRNTNIYQILTYASALGCRGLLLYPQFDEEIKVSYRLGPVEFEIQTVDLDLPNLSGIRSFAQQFQKVLAA